MSGCRHANARAVCLAASIAALPVLFADLAEAQQFGGQPIAAPHAAAAPGPQTGPAFAPPAAQPPPSTPPLQTEVIAAPPVGPMPPNPWATTGPIIADQPPSFAFVDTRPPRFWLRSEYLLWAFKSGPLPAPLATIGSPLDSTPGALGQPGTSILYGGENIHFGATGGVRLDGGWWIDPNQTFAIEAGGFLLGRQTAGFSDFSDAAGFPLIARPTINAQNGNEGSYVDSFPNLITGGITVDNTSQLGGWEINGGMNLFQTERFRLLGLAGFRYVNLTESILINDQLAGLVPGQLTFLGQPIPLDDTLADFDSFKTTNNFYGGQLGTRLTWNWWRLSISAGGRVALGTMQERTVIDGGTAVFTPSGAASFAPGGILATSANMGSYYRSRFAVVPEANFNVNLQMTPRLSLRLGYSFIYLSNVLRPGNQISRVVSPNLVPSDAGYGQPGPNQPANQFHSSTYWAQGGNIGLLLSF